ncbi:MAG: Hpt domain-containing protein [Paracoccaceae bacterium]
MIDYSPSRKTSAEKVRSETDVPNILLPARARFSDKLTQRAMAFEMFRIDFNNGQNPRTALVNINELAHKIAGVAETIGFPEAGRLATALERSTSSGYEQHASIEETWRIVEPQLVALVDELELIMDA